MIRLRLTAFFLLILSPGSVGLALGGQLITHTITSEHLAGNLLGESPTKEIIVQLPLGYEQGQEKYPVVYWFPGAGQRSTIGIDLPAIDQEFLSGRSDPAIIVLMPGLTSFGSSAYLSSEAFGDWEGFLTAEVIPFIDNTYRTHASPTKRGIMGFSLGGFTSLMLPLLNPGTFGAIGMNDPGTSFTSAAVRTIEEIPPGVELDEDFNFDEFYAGFPDTVEGYAQAPLIQTLYGQLAARISPNPDNPLQGDLPFNAVGEFTSAVELWRDYDLLNPASVELHREALAALSTLSVTLPTDSQGSPWNRELVRVLQAAGFPAQGIEVEGEHNERWYERFTQLLSDVTYGMRGVSEHVLSTDVYAQDFDAALSLNDTDGVLLPSGWSVTDSYGYVFRDRTNTAFAGGNVAPIGQTPYILNAGGDQAEDRSLAVYVPNESPGTTIQFLAEVPDIAANALQLQFDIEAWDQLGQAAGMQGEAAFDVTFELDFGQGFEEVLDVGHVTTGPRLEALDAPYVDGNSEDYRVSFSSDVLVAPLSLARSLRVRWTTDGLGASGGWVFGLDNVTLNLLLLGDFDLDGELTDEDIDLLSAAVRSGVASGGFDLNGDDRVDDEDRARWVRELAGTNYGDANLDREVTLADFLTLSQAFGSTAGWGHGDFDGNGEVGFADFLLLVNDFGASSAYSVPEPALGATWIVMLVSGLAFRCRQNRATAC